MKVETSDDEITVPQEQEFDLLYCLTREEPNEKDVDTAIWSISIRLHDAIAMSDHEGLNVLQHELYAAADAAKRLPDSPCRTNGIAAASALMNLAVHGYHHTRPAQKDAWVRSSRLARAIILALPEDGLTEVSVISVKTGGTLEGVKKRIDHMSATGLVLIDEIVDGGTVTYVRLTPAGVALQKLLRLEKKRRG